MEEINIKELSKLRQKMTIPQLSDHFGIGARKLEKILAKYNIKKLKSKHK